MERGVSPNNLLSNLNIPSKIQGYNLTSHDASQEFFFKAKNNRGIPCTDQPCMGYGVYGRARASG